VATRAAMAAREAEVQKRLEAAVTTLALRFNVEPAPPFAPVRDAQYRAIDEREQLVLTLEALVDASEQPPERGVTATATKGNTRA
jgi:hypothetical protein